MDKIEKFIKDDLSFDDKHEALDVDSILEGTHSRIKRRAARRKALYSSPAVLVLLVVVYFVLPQNVNEFATLEGELFISGWETSWTESELLYEDDSNDDILFEQSIDYLTDEQFYSYIDDADELLDDSDLEAFIGYLKEA